MKRRTRRPALPETRSAEHIFTIGVPNGKRDDAIAALNAAGIHVAVNFRSVPGTRYYSQKYPQALGECPIAGLWGSQTLTLPTYPSLTREEQDYVIKVVREQVYAPALLRERHLKIGAYEIGLLEISSDSFG